MLLPPYTIACMDIDLTPVIEARERAERVEAEARAAIKRAHADYGSAVAELVEQHSAREVASALGVSRGRVYQLMGKADED